VNNTLAYFRSFGFYTDDLGLELRRFTIIMTWFSLHMLINLSNMYINICYQAQICHLKMCICIFKIVFSYPKHAYSWYNKNL